jgi:hypothetical protein
MFIWRVRSPITAYRVYREAGEVFVEYEGNRGKIMSYLFVGAFVYYLAHVHVITNELEKIAEVLTKEAAELQTHYETQTSAAEEMAEGVEVHETHQKKKKTKKKMRSHPRKRRNSLQGFAGVQNMIRRGWSLTQGVALD